MKMRINVGNLARQNSFGLFENTMQVPFQEVARRYAEYVSSEVDTFLSGRGYRRGLINLGDDVARSFYHKDMDRVLVSVDFTQGKQSPFVDVETGEQILMDLEVFLTQKNSSFKREISLSGK